MTISQFIKRDSGRFYGDVLLIMYHAYYPYVFVYIYLLIWHS